MLKKLTSLVIVFSLLLVSLPAFAQDAIEPLTPAQPPPIESKASPMEVMFLIDSGLDKNYEQIRAKAMSLTEQDKAFILQSKRKEPILGFLLNLLIGFGVGSFVLGDINGGLTEIGGEVGGLTLAVVGAVVAGTGTAFNPGSTSVSYNPTSGIIGGFLAVVGLLTIMGFRIYGFIQPFNYANGYNTKLQGALSGVSLSIVPYTRNGEVGVQTSFVF